MSISIGLSENPLAQTAINAVLELKTKGPELEKSLTMVDGLLGKRISRAEGDAFVMLLTGLEAQGRLSHEDVGRLSQRTNKEAVLRNAFTRALRDHQVGNAGKAAITGILFGAAAWASMKLTAGAGHEFAQFFLPYVCTVLGFGAAGIILDGADRSQLYGVNSYEAELEPLVKRHLPSAAE